MENYLDITLSVNPGFYEGKTLDISVDIEPVIGRLGYGNDEFTFKDKYTPSLNDKLYFLKGVNIPRVKMKNLATDYKIKTVRDISEATHIFGSTSSLDKISDVNWKYSIATSDFKLFLEEGGKNYIDSYNMGKLTTALEFYENTHIISDYNSIVNIIHSTKLPFQTSILPHRSSSERFTAIDDDMKDVFVFIQGKDLYDESSLLLHLNGDDAIEIDAEMYASLCEMFDSSDRDNWTLAMEIMANSHYDKSLLYLELLFCDYSNKICDVKSKNHVNFKSLTSFLNKSYQFNTDIDCIMNTLKKHNKFTKENLDIILRSKGNKIQDRGNTTYFQVKTITVVPEVLDIMNENYEFTVVEEHVFKNKEEMIEEEIVPEIIETQIQDESTDYYAF